jgi:hypothetical protein
LKTPDFTVDKPAPLLVKDSSTVSSKESLRRNEKVVKIQAAARGWMIRKMLNKKTPKKITT